MNAKVTYWVDLAGYDMDTAKAMLQTGRLLYVGFMCHQVAEKMLKAWWASTRDSTPPHTHNLVTLATLSGLFDVLDSAQRGLLDTLGPLNVESRYPADQQRLLAALTPERCEMLIGQTEELRQWIHSKLSTS
ncbi:MAG: HEPN domain-containing protein [Phycisphaerae bacterium]|nr:HEPN domain-containing protein [Phycisphaerae bacterium]